GAGRGGPGRAPARPGAAPPGAPAAAARPRSDPRDLSAEVRPPLERADAARDRDGLLVPTCEAHVAGRVDEPRLPLRRIDRQVRGPLQRPGSGHEPTPLLGANGNAVELPTPSSVVPAAAGRRGPGPPVDVAVVSDERLGKRTVRLAPLL